MRILVTGATGFLGHHVVAALLARGHSVRALVRPGDHLPRPEGADCVEGDIREPAALVPALEGRDAVVHLAALISYWRRDAELLAAVNEEGTRNLVEACRGAGVRRFLHLSSVGAVGFRPDGGEADEAQPYNWPRGLLYMESKRRGEEIVLEATRRGELDAVVVNAASIMGPGDPEPATAHNRLYAGIYRSPLFLGSFSGGLAVVDVRDLAALAVAGLERGRAGERYLAAGANLPFAEVLALIGRRAGRPVLPFPIPAFLFVAAGLVAEGIAELTGRRPLLTAAYGRVSGIRAYYSNRKGVAELGASYRPMAETIDDACAWYEARFLAGRGTGRGGRDRAAKPGP